MKPFGFDPSPSCSSIALFIYFRKRKRGTKKNRLRERVLTLIVDPYCSRTSSFSE